MLRQSTRLNRSCHWRFVKMNLMETILLLTEMVWFQLETVEVVTCTFVNVLSYKLKGHPCLCLFLYQRQRTHFFHFLSIAFILWMFISAVRCLISCIENWTRVRALCNERVLRHVLVLSKFLYVFAGLFCVQNNMKFSFHVECHLFTQFLYLARIENA